MTHVSEINFFAGHPKLTSFWEIVHNEPSRNWKMLLILLSLFVADRLTDISLPHIVTKNFSSIFPDFYSHNGSNHLEVTEFRSSISNLDSMRFDLGLKQTHISWTIIMANQLLLTTWKLGFRGGSSRFFLAEAEPSQKKIWAWKSLLRAYFELENLCFQHTLSRKNYFKLPYPLDCSPTLE